MSSLICIDPGPEESGFVFLRSGVVEDAMTAENRHIRAIVIASAGMCDALAIEMVASYGMPVGKDVFETVLWVGRFDELWFSKKRERAALIYRKDVKLHLCGTPRAKDANIRQALIDRYGPGKDKAIGKKASPGPLYGVKKHAWAALAVGVTHLDRSGCNDV